LFRPMSFCWSWRKGGRIESAPQPGPSPELERLQHELRHLKRALRDLVALSVMPAAWVGRSSRDIANGVLELLFSTLRLEAAYVCIDANAGEEQCEAAKCTEGPHFQKWIEENKEKLRPRRKLEGVLPPILLSSDSAQHLRLEARAIGMDRSFGFVVVGSCRPDFPREEEKLLVSVAVNQAATALQSAQLTAERAAVSKELVDSEERFRAIVETTPECVKLVAADGTLLHMNSAGLAMIGAECADLALGKNIYDVIGPENRENFRDFNERICRGERGSLEFDIIGLTGIRRHMETYAAPFRTKNGSIVQLGVTRDVSQRKRAEEVQHKLAAIVESSDDAIVSKDLNGIVTSWNRSAEQMFGYTAAEMIGRSILTIIPPELRSDEDMILSKIRRGEKIEHFETVRQTKAGERVEVSLSISPVRDDQGRIVGAAKIARNMTEKKKIEKALRTTEKLAAAGRLAATVAHEINNPLEAVNNLVFLAKRDLKDTQRASGHLDLAERELGRVAHIARQTLGFYRDTSSPAPINIAKTFDDLLYLYEKRLEVRNIRVIKRYKGDIEITAYPGEIRQALSNLITNAMDAMPGGGTLVIRVRTDHEWDGSKSTGVRITIADSGTGIKPEHSASLFEPFFTTKADVGTGLGLWITRGIVAKHGGKIQVKSSIDVSRHGTTFSIFLPFREQSAATQPEVAPEVSSGLVVQ
jgi:PAS domain S-box-containing protein